MKQIPKKLGISISMIWASRNIVHSGLLEKLSELFDVQALLRSTSAELEAACQKKGVKVQVLSPVIEKRGYKLYRNVFAWLYSAHKGRNAKNTEKFKQGLFRRNFDHFEAMRYKIRDSFFSFTGNSIFYDFLVFLERFLYCRTTDLKPLLSFLQREKFDLLLLTAPLQQESREFHLLRACKKLGIPVVAMILGFDNFTTKGRLSELPEYFLVWNNIMKEELLRVYPTVSAARIFVTGSPQFDFYAGEFWGGTRENFCQQHGLNPVAPLVFYSANTATLVPHEPLLVEDLIKKARQEADLQALQFIVRLHPFERAPERWQRVKEMSDVLFTRPWTSEDDGAWGYVNEADIHLLTGSLKHAICNFNISSTMALDAVFCDRPVLAPAYDVNDKNDLSQHVRALYEREFYVPIVTSRAITLIESTEESLDAIRTVLSDPSLLRTERNALTLTMLGQPVGQSADCIVDILKHIA